MSRPKPIALFPKETNLLQSPPTCANQSSPARCSSLLTMTLPRFRDKSDENTRQSITSPVNTPPCRMLLCDGQRRQENATRTETAGEGHWQTEAAQQQHTERLRINSHDSIHWECCELDGRHRTTFRIGLIPALTVTTMTTPFFSVLGVDSWKPFSANHGGVRSVHDPSISSFQASHLLQPLPNLGYKYQRFSNVLPHLPLIPNWPPPSRPCSP